MQSMLENMSKSQTQDDYEDLEKWFKSEVHSHDGLTWTEFKDKCASIAKKHGYKPSAHDWRMIRASFDNADLDGSGVITPDDFKVPLS